MGKQLRLIVLLAATLCALRWFEPVAAAKNAGAAAPQVTATQPANGAVDVPSDLKELVVTFDQEMDHSGYSFVRGGPTFPKTRGDAFWRTARECVLPVELSPRTSYIIGINSVQHAGFKSMKGVPATPYDLRFTTTAGIGAPAADAPGAHVDAVRQLREAVEKRYSHRQTRPADWASLWTRTAPELIAAKSAKEFAVIAGEMLAATSDPHIWLEANGEVVPAFRRSVTPNVSLPQLPKLISKWTTPNNVVATGWAAPDVGYVAIHSWERKHGKDAFEPAFKALEGFRDAPALIIDVRLNSGGDELIAREFAGCFVEQRALYARHIIIDSGSPDGFGAPVERWVEPSAGRPHYAGKVAVLIGPVNMSSAESFLLMMKRAPKATLIGERTYGSSGNPKPYALRNGVTVYLPSWTMSDARGTALERKGIVPDVEVVFGPAQSKQDAVLESALKHLREAGKRGS